MTRTSNNKDVDKVSGSNQLTIAFEKKQGQKNGFSSFLELTKEPDPDDSKINLIKMLIMVYFARADDVTGELWTIHSFSSLLRIITQADLAFYSLGR